MSWHVTTGERTDALADALADLLSTPLADPLAEEVVVVPAKGMERWLTQRLSHRLGAPEASGGVPRGGVCAGVRFVSPRSLVATLTGRERDDPWDPDRLVWPLLEVIDSGLDEAWCATIARHLGHGRGGDGGDADELAQVRAGRRYSLARRLAGLFASYGVQRPSVLTDWREGRATDGAGEPLDTDLAWQPELWRRLVERVDADPPDVRHTDTLARLAAGDPTLDLPGRLSFFGHTRIPRTEIELLAALATHRDVHLWLPQASQRVWRDLASACAAGPVRRADDDTGRLVAHPLLASLGRDARELQRTLALAGPTAPDVDSGTITPEVLSGAIAFDGALGRTGFGVAPESAASDVASAPTTTSTPAQGGEASVGEDSRGFDSPSRAGRGVDEPARTTLEWLQHDLRAGQPPTPPERAARRPAPDDDSVRVHACHGPARQVEVLREVLVGLLADDPTLEPRDIIVLCPDIEAYAPLVQASFGLGGVDDGGDGRPARGDRHPGHRLRVRLADRSLTATNPLAALASDLLRLVGGRMTAGDVLDLAASAPVRRRFALSDDDLERITRWVEQAAIRWGRDAHAREPYRLGQFGQNTWRFGIDRLLLGVASAERHELPQRESARISDGSASQAQPGGVGGEGGSVDGVGGDPAGAVPASEALTSQAPPGDFGGVGRTADAVGDDRSGGPAEQAHATGDLPGLSVADLLPALPIDDVAGGDIDLVGRLAELVDRLGAVVERLEEATVASEWTAALGEGVRDLADVAPTEVWQVAQLERELAAVAEASSPDTRLRLADVRALLAHRFAGHPTRANFRTGTLTVATMVPMRSVPHRVVALLGLDDGVFPRHESVDGDDVLARAPLTGERDPRSEDRQLLLDAIMSATDHLVVTYTGAGEHTGTPRPPAVPLGELIDALTVTVAQPGGATDGAPASSTDRSDASAGPPIVVHHRLQPFAPANFVAGSLGRSGPFSFDAAALAGARALTGVRTPLPPLLEAPLPAPPVADVDLDDLLAFYAHPVRHFLRTRLDVTAPLEADEPDDAMPVALDALEKWAVGDRLLTDALAGVDPEVAVRAEKLRGLLPPGGLAAPVLGDVLDVIGALVRTVHGVRGHAAPHSVDVDVDLGGGRRLSGTVANVYAPPSDSAGAARHVTVTYSSVSAKRRLEAWVTLLALTAGDPSREYTSHAIGRRGGRAVTATVNPIEVARARELLLELVDVYDRGRCEPLPLAPRTAFAYADAFASGARGRQADPVFAARVEWEGKDRDAAIPGERADSWHVRAYGTNAPLELLLTPALDGEDWNTAPDRLGRYALRVWDPVLAGQVLR